MSRLGVVNMAKAADTLQSSYDKLLAKYKDLMIVQSTRNLVEWDMETKMPPRGIALRSQQLALLSQFEHKISIDPEIGPLLKKVEKQPGYKTLNNLQKRNVHLIRKNYDEQTKLPEKLVKETARQRAIAIDVWKKAKTAQNFSMFKPELGKLYDLKKQAAEILMEVKNTASPYDALIDIFEPKMTSDLIAKTFDKLKRSLIPLIKKCASAPRQPKASILRRKIPIDTQREISNSLAEFIGYDVQSKNAGGRIDETEHPFTTGYFDDVRITTHYYEDNVASSIFSILHEAGHAIYDQNLNHQWMYQPIGEGCSYGFHESQSRFVENIVGRSREFWAYHLPKLKALVGKTFSDVDVDTFVHEINQVKPSKIRIEADEVTYCLHIIIRFEIERELFEEKVKIAELPEVWNQKYMDYLGMKIENDSEGVMQDTHWASGYFGYFPSYALGNIYSGQILFTMQKDIPNWRDLLKKGDFHRIKQWLTKNVHSQGKLYDPMDLLKKIIGEEINVKHYIDYLDAKFSELYGF
jgi:carboxypeptidase Taq